MASSTRIESGIWNFSYCRATGMLLNLEKLASGMKIKRLDSLPTSNSFNWSIEL